LASDEEAVGRLRAAIDVRDELDPDFVIVGRTDAAGAQGGGLEEAIRRGQLYQKAGADVVFFAGFSAWSDIRTALAAIDGPAYAIPDFGQSGRHPSLDDLTKMGQAINVVPFVFPGVQEVWDLLLKIRDSNDLSAYDDYLEHIFSLKGTERFVGIGDQFISPDHQTLASMEGKYLPRQS
jgi:2-methylisocitrate lyase-like PEP mutase family enzyme